MLDTLKNNVLIIVPRYIPYQTKAYYEFPLGLAYISACVKNQGYVVDILNLNNYEEPSLELIQQKFLHKNYSYVLSGGLSAHYKQLQRIVKDVRLVNTTATVILGGGGLSATPELMYNTLKPDYIVIGEGEITIGELLDALDIDHDISTVPGIAYSKHGVFVKTLPRESIKDLDSIPRPDFDGFEFDTYLESQRSNDSLYNYSHDSPRFYPIISSRGCPYNCTFCYHPLGRYYRSRSVEKFLEEVEYAITKYKINNFAIFDELLSLNRDRLVRICDGLKKYAPDVKWMCQLRVDCVDEELLFKMKDSGCFLISYGLESASDAILKSMNKHITKDQIEKALIMTRNAGIGIQAYFIFGDTRETVDTARETLDFWKRYKDYHITLGYIRPYPGSDLWQQQIDTGKLETFDQQLAFLDLCIASPPNLTSMTPDEWFELQKDVQKELLLNDHRGEALDSYLENDDTYTITFRCSHCDSVQVYKHFKQRILGIFKIVCRECNQAMNMSPMIFTHVREDYNSNYEVYHKVLSGEVPVVVTPCMNEAEFEAMRELLLKGANVVAYMDKSIERAAKQYQGKSTYLTNYNTIKEKFLDYCFVIPLTRYANVIFNELLSFGIHRKSICRLDEVTI